MAVTAAIIDSAEREDGHRELLEEDVVQAVVSGNISLHLDEDVFVT